MRRKKKRKYESYLREGQECGTASTSTQLSQYEEKEKCSSSSDDPATQVGGTLRREGSNAENQYELVASYRSDSSEDSEVERVEHSDILL